MALPQQSLAAVLSAYQEPVAVHEITIPALEPGAALVEVVASTICGTDVHIRRGDFPMFAHLPLVMGHEIVGRVVALGPERRVDAVGMPLREGDLVAWAYAWCGECFWCTVARQPTLCEHPRMYGWGSAAEFPYLTGGFSQYVYVMPRCDMVHVPEGVDPAVAAAATCSFRTVVHGFERLGAIEPWETIVIQGSGPVGLWSLAWSVVAGARQVIVLGAPESRLAVARRWGAGMTLNILETTVEERRAAIMAATEGRGPDIVVEASGASNALPEGLALVRRGGRYLVIGQGDPRPASIDGRWINTKQLSIVGLLSGEVRHYWKAMQFLAQYGDRFPFADLLGQRYRLAEVNHALDRMQAMAELKPVVVPNG